jgi:hypothetical protein
VRPRDPWLINRATIQPGARFQTQFAAAQADTLEAAAKADDIDDLFERLEAARQMLRLDRKVTPTMFRGASISEGEVEILSQIQDVVRLGHVAHIGRDELHLAQGSIVAEPDTLYVDCTAKAFAQRPCIPVFQGDRITPQTVRGGVVPLSAALIAHVEAAYDDEETKNQLCPPVLLAERREDWISWQLADMEVGARWSKDPDLRQWILTHRLSGFRAGEARPEATPQVKAINERIRAARPRAMANLRRLQEAAAAS